MSSCDHNCGNCSSKCSKEDFLVPANANSKITKVIAIKHY